MHGTFGASSPDAGGGAFASLAGTVELLVVNDRQISALMARRAVLLEDARRQSEAAVSHSEGAGSSSREGWSSPVIARRELVSSVACALRLPERTAENLIEVSHLLVTRLRATHSALGDGRIRYRQAETIVDHATSLPTESMAEFEAAVLEIAPDLTNAQLEGRARRLRERMHPESISERHRAAVDRRCVDLTPARDGMAWLSAHLPAATATAAYNRITDLALENEGAGEGGTLTQLRADVFADLLVDGFTHDLTEEPAQDLPTVGRPVRSIRSGIGRGILATVNVTVPVMTLLGAVDAPAELEGYGPIDSVTAKKLAAGAPSFHRILTHPETGAVLSVGRDSYTVPADLRRWLITRDETCRFPGCNRAARRSDVDHSIDWQYNGATVHDNLAHLCASHHHLKHQTAWSYTQHAGGRLEWTSPTGHRYATKPAVHFHNEIPSPQWVEQNGAAVAKVAEVAARGYDFTDPATIAHAERFIPHPDDPPDVDWDDPYLFVIHEAS